MSLPEYYSSQILTTSINIEPQYIKGDISKLILYNIKKRYEGVCNKDGYIEKDSIELINRSIGESRIIDNKSYIIYHITYKACIVSPSIGNVLKCIVNSNNKMGLIGCIKKKDTDSIKDSPFIIIVPAEFYDDPDILSTIKIGDTVEVKIENFRTKYLAKQIQIVARPT